MSDKQKPKQSGIDPRTKPRRRWRRRVLLAAIVVPLIALAAVFYLARSEPAHWKAFHQRLADKSPDQLEAIASNVERRLAMLGMSEAELQWLDGEQDTLSYRNAAARGQLWIGRDGSIAAANMSAGISARDSAGVIPVKAMPLSEMRVDIERKILLSQDEIDALIITRLNKWMSDRGYVMPPQIGDPMLQLTQNGMLMAFEYRSRNFSQVMTADFDMEIFSDGYAELRLRSFSAGRLPVPTDQIAAYLQKSGENAGEAAKVGKWLSRLERLEFKPVLELDNRRRARVTDFVLRPDGVELTLRMQDYQTYRKTNDILAAGKATLDEVQAIASVPTPLD